MKIQGNTVLITGGTSGIGLALAERFLKAGNTVAICGRRGDKLREAQARLPGLITRVCDVAVAKEREALLRWAQEELPELNVLVNNAGLQRYLDFGKLTAAEDGSGEIDVNLKAPIHLSALFIPWLKTQPHPVLAMVSSGLAFVPLAVTPVYSATKAAIHSFTLSLRKQLAGTPIQVVELIPPHVNTDLGIPGGNGAGMPLRDYIDSAMAGLAAGDAEVTVGFSTKTSQASRAELDGLFGMLNGAAH